MLKATLLCKSLISSGTSDIILIIMYLVKRLFGKKETFLSQQEFNQEQLFLCSMDYRVNIAIEIFKSALEFTLGLTLLPDPLATLFFILSLSSLFTIVTLYQRTQINELYRITHSLLFEVVYLWNFGNLNYLLVYLIYVSSTIDREIMKIFYYVMFQIVYEMMNYKQFEIGKGEQIFVWLILISIILGLFIKNQKKQVYSPQQFSIAKDQEEDLLLDVNERQYVLIIKV
ncbi:hypothetical protein FGO68_gene7393 [Halteria grandinella]|uniref:Transmembrane protein n=1 Tax=Halteria grandinella TaxID=5974 RepID=A0A8J8SYF9_HALGN|nr:hypothetical protein FGO68_gene7393 [Halteria grandinella]